MTNEQPVEARETWTYEPEDYRRAASYLSKTGVHVPSGTLTYDTISAVITAASGRGVSPSIKVLLLAFHIALEQLDRARAQIRLLDDEADHQQARIAELEKDVQLLLTSQYELGATVRTVKEISAHREVTLRADVLHARAWARWWRHCFERGKTRADSPTPDTASDGWSGGLERMPEPKDVTT